MNRLLVSAARCLLLTGLYSVGIVGLAACSGGGGGSGAAAPAAVTATASFSVSPAGGAAPLDVNFDGSASTTSAGMITAYEWDFGDGVTLTTAGATVAHRYTVANDYTARLTIRSSSNATGNTTRVVTVATAQQAVWLGAYLSSLYPDAPLRADLSRAGNVLSGTYEDGDGRSGTLELTINGNSVALEFQETTPGCSGSFTGTGQLDLTTAPGASAVLFDFTGVNCEGTHADGEGALIEQLARVLAWGREGLGEMRVDAGEVFFTDASEFPLHKVDVATGLMTPLAYAMRAVTSLTLAGSDLLWTDFTNDIGETGCAGAGARRALVRAAANGSNPRRITEGDFCSASVQESALSDGTYAYWIRVDTAGPLLERVPLAGGAPERIATLGTSVTTVFALDATHIYWTETIGAGGLSQIKRCPLAGCGVANPTVISQATTYELLRGIALAGDQIYVSLRRDGSFAPAIARVPKAGGPAVDIVQDASGDFLQTDGSSLYWSDTDNLSLSRVASAPIGGGLPVTLAGGLSLFRGLALGATHVYWIEGTTGTNQNDGKVRRVAKAGGPIENLKLDAAWPAHIQVDATGAALYADGGLEEFREQGIRKVTPAGVTTTVAKGIPPTGPLAVDDNAVYVPAGFNLVKLSRVTLGAAENFSPTAFFVRRIEADGTNVYWLETDPFGNVFRAPVAGTATPVLLGNANGQSSQLRLSRDYVYANALPDGLYRVAKTGGPSETLADNLAFPDDFVVDEIFAYVVESDARAITRIDLPTNARTAAVPANSLPLFMGWWAFAQDNSALFLMNPSSLERYGKGNGLGATPYGPVLQDPFSDEASVAVDATHLYWTETLLGAIKTAPK